MMVLVCITWVVLIQQQNYDSTATFDDGSCLYPCFDALTYSTSFEDGMAQIGLNPSDWTNNTDDNSGGSSIYGDWIWDESWYWFC